MRYVLAGFRPYRRRGQSAGQERSTSTGPAVPPTGNLDGWLAKAEEHPGSWWPDWLQWIKDQNPTETEPREPGGGKLEPIEDAPGSYVRVRD